jgi:hypothetical protein
MKLLITVICSYGANSLAPIDHGSGGSNNNRGMADRGDLQ